MNDIREDIVTVRSWLNLTLANNRQLRSALKDVMDRCEREMKKDNLSAESLRLAINILQICRGGGV